MVMDSASHSMRLPVRRAITPSTRHQRGFVADHEHGPTAWNLAVHSQVRTRN